MRAVTIQSTKLFQMKLKTIRRYQSHLTEKTERTFRSTQYKSLSPCVRVCLVTHLGTRGYEAGASQGTHRQLQGHLRTVSIGAWQHPGRSND